MRRGTFEDGDFVWINEEDDPRHVLNWAGYAVRHGVVSYSLEDIDTDPRYPPPSCSVGDFPTVFKIHFGQLKC